jgi:transposase InsO family protein
MTWQAPITVEARRAEFVRLAQSEAIAFRELCRRFGISPTTGYKWLSRAEAAAATGQSDWMDDRSRRPHGCSHRTDAEIETQVVALRRQHPTWGGRKLRAALQRAGVATAPSASTITAILRRHDLLDPASSAQHTAPTRFVHPFPNVLWQMDFMGHLPLGDGGRVHPLCLLDDCSRYCLGIWACADERKETVVAHLTAAFATYGLPQIILTDNGPPWGTSGAGGITMVEAHLLQLGITVWHGHPYHPQTQGKVERFHRTLGAELRLLHRLADLEQAQRTLTAFRQTYNTQRPHEALALQVPADRYRPSDRAAPDEVPEPVYAPGDTLRKVRGNGTISVDNRPFFVGGGLVGRTVGLRPTTVTGIMAVYFCHQQVATIDLRTDS